MSLIENVTQSRLLRISNVHAVGTSSSTNFTVNLNRMTETNNIVRCVCKSVSFPNNAYNIITSGVLANNEFSYEILGDAAYTVTVPTAGFYTTTELLAIIQPAIDAQVKVIDPAATVTFAIDPFSKLIVMSVSGSLAVQVGGLKLNVVMGNTVNSGFINNTSYSFDSLRDLYGLKTVFLHSTTIAEGNLVDGDVENHDILAEIPVTAPWGSMNFYESQDDELDSINYDSVRNFDQITITLRDLNNDIIELNGGDVVVVLKLYYV